MIKKDINLNHISPAEPVVHNNHSASSVDDIFAAADAKMQSQTIGPRLPQTQRRENSLLKALKGFLVFAAVTMIAICGLITYAMTNMFPTIRDNLVSQFQAARDELMALDDSTLTTEEYYQKQLLLLITEDDITSAVQDMMTIEGIVEIFTNDGTVMIDVIPEDKRDEYNRLMEEYQQAMESEKQQNEESTSEPTQ